MGCNNAFCKILGFNKENVIKKISINSLIPQYLHKKHEQAIKTTLNDSNFLMHKNNTFVLGMHASGYLVPLRATAQRQISFSENAQFVVRFVPVPYTSPTLHLLVGLEGNVEAASSGLHK